MSGNVVVEVAGILTDPNFQRMRSMALQLREQVSSVTVIFHSMVEADYVPFLDKRGLLLQFPHHNTSAPIAFMPVADSNNDGDGDTYIGDTDAFLDLCAQKYQLEDTLTGRDAIVKATEAWEEYRSRSRNVFCFFKFASDDQQFNDRVVIELFQDVCPLACENFATLCRSDTKNGYNGLPVHRIVPGGWIQSGDVECGGRGDGERGGIVHEDGLFEDEAFSFSHDKPGIVVPFFCYHSFNHT
ncbi:hypothetical protein LEN26_020218 [Aphanomyces euteiches]|nr:hypothetical protein LEN26_020218 [Aphanomyces euteiches]KAH9116829.1 hypothetical protein AeMF1_009286 [Aphanomyces euteiches]